MATKVLIIEDDPALRASIVQTLELEELEPIPTNGFLQARRTIRSNFNGVILSDIKMPDHDGFDVLGFVKGLDPELPVVLLTGHSDVPTAMRAIREGAYDYLEKPCETDNLVDTLRRALDYRALVLDKRAVARRLDRADTAAQNFPGHSPASAGLRDALRAAAQSDGPLHVWGETGVGKRTAAFVVHSLGQDDRDFTSLNCDMATVADVAKLDTSQPLTLSVRDVQAAHPDLIAAIGDLLTNAPDLRIMTTATGPFDDLGLTWPIPQPTEIYVPSLAERADDLRDILEHCLRQAARTSGADMPFLSPEILQPLSTRTWSGNLKDMRAYAARLLVRHPDPDPATLTERIDTYEKSLIAEALSAHDGKVALAAKALGVPRNTLYDRMNRLGLVAKDFRSG